MKNHVYENQSKDLLGSILSTQATREHNNKKITKCHLVLLSSSKDTEVIYTNYFCPKVIGLRYIN